MIAGCNPFESAGREKGAEGFSPAVALPSVSMPRKGDWKYFHFGWIWICLGACICHQRLQACESSRGRTWRATYIKENFKGRRLSSGSRVSRSEGSHPGFCLQVENLRFINFLAPPAVSYLKDHSVILTVGCKLVQLVQGEIVSHSSITQSHSVTGEKNVKRVPCVYTEDERISVKYLEWRLAYSEHLINASCCTHTQKNCSWMACCLSTLAGMPCLLKNEFNKRMPIWGFVYIYS